MSNGSSGPLHPCWDGVGDQHPTPSSCRRSRPAARRERWWASSVPTRNLRHGIDPDHAADARARPSCSGTVPSAGQTPGDLSAGALHGDGRLGPADAQDRRRTCGGAEAPSAASRPRAGSWPVLEKVVAATSRVHAETKRGQAKVRLRALRGARRRAIRTGEEPPVGTGIIGQAGVETNIGAVFTIRGSWDDHPCGRPGRGHQLPLRLAALRPGIHRSRGETRQTSQPLAAEARTTPATSSAGTARTARSTSPGSPRWRRRRAHLDCRDRG